MRAELEFVAPWSVFSPAPSAFAELPALTDIPTLRELAGLATALMPAVADLQRTELSPVERTWLDGFGGALAEASLRASARIEQIERLCEAVRSARQHGVRLSLRRGAAPPRHRLQRRRARRDASYYDLLASEARLSQLRRDRAGTAAAGNWFASGPLLTRPAATCLLSWSGSMFEYLMPLLVMPTYEHTLLDRT
jgi:hypothetical protein